MHNTCMYFTVATFMYIKHVHIQYMYMYMYVFGLNYSIDECLVLCHDVQHTCTVDSTVKDTLNITTFCINALDLLLNDTYEYNITCPPKYRACLILCPIADMSFF